MNARDRLRIALGALYRWRKEARRLFLACPLEEVREVHAEWLDAYLYSAQLTALVLLLEREATR